MANYDSIEKLMDGYSPVRQRLSETRQLVEKWEPTGLLEGLKDEVKVHNMAVLLENQARQLIDESSKTGGSSSEEWSGVALPLVRRIFGELAAQDFVSVQPMNLPSGLIFYLDFKYGTDQAGFDKDGDVFGTTNLDNVQADGGLYGKGKGGYSINDIPATIADANWESGSATWADVNFDGNLSASAAAGNLHKLLVDVSELSGYDAEGIKSFEISGSGTNELTAYYPAYTKKVSDQIQFIVDPKAGMTSSANMIVKYHKQPEATSRGDFEQSTFSVPSPNSADDVGIPEIDISLRQISIVAKTRKLKAIWTPELAQDLNAYHSVDAEAELTSMLSEYISMEIDLEILDMLQLNAYAKTEYWSARVGYEYVGSSFVEDSAASNAYTKGTWYQTLGNKIQSVSNAIHQKTLRGGANFLVVSPTTATILESIPGYATDATGEATAGSFAMGVQKVGMLNNRFNVYKNPYWTDDTILVGFRGANFLETGAVYAPYVPLIMTPLVYDPVNFTPRKGVMTRYAKKIVRPEFYGQVHVADSNRV